MSNRVDLAKQLLRDGEFAIAKQMLEKELADPQSLYLLSLLYRYDDEYDQEKTIVDKMLDIDGSNTYMQERRAWLNLPIFDRVVPRQPLCLPRDPKTIPNAEVLESAAFVSGADANYFKYLVQLIESIQDSCYSDLPICILDCGLQEHQKHILESIYHIQTIVLAQWKIPVNQGTINVCGKNVPLTTGYQAIMNKPYLFDYFPDYEYLCWIDADCWIQDAGCFDDLLSHANANGVGVTSFNQNKNVATGVYAIKKSHQFTNVWKRKYDDLLHTAGFGYGGEEMTLALAMHELNIQNFLPAEMLYRMSQSNVPYFFLPFRTLVAPATGNPIAIYAFDAFTEKDVIFWPIAERDRPFCMQTEFDQYIQKSNWLMQQQKRNDFSQLQAYEKQKPHSLHYRVWPWQDKQSILSRIFDTCLISDS